LIRGFILIGVTEALLALVYIVPIVFLVCSLEIWDMGLYIIPFFMDILIFRWALGVLNIGLLVHFGPSADILAFFIPFLILPFSAVYYPISVFPSVLQNITFILPTRHMFEGMRTAITLGAIPYNSLLWATVLNLVCLALGFLFLHWMLALARRKG
jgi:ABC-2 type transport system permease protein